MKFADFLTDRIILQNGQRQADPRVSIIMPTYCRNAEGLLRPCIESVLAQTFKDFEFIIVDDGSTDGSEEVIRGYMEREPRIVYVRHSMKCGLPALRTDEGILLARGPYVGFIFDDNTWKADALEQMVRGIEASGADIVYGNAILAQGGGENRIFGNLPLTVELLQNFNTILNAAVLCRQKFFEHYGFFDPPLLLPRPFARAGWPAPSSSFVRS